VHRGGPAAAHWPPLMRSIEAVEKPFLQGKYLLLVKISDIIVNKIF
jgi:hypothetical protein